MPKNITSNSPYVLYAQVLTDLAFNRIDTKEDDLEAEDILVGDLEDILDDLLDGKFDNFSDDQE